MLQARTDVRLAIYAKRVIVDLPQRRFVTLIERRFVN